MLLSTIYMYMDVSYLGDLTQRTCISRQYYITVATQSATDCLLANVDWMYDD